MKKLIALILLVGCGLDESSGAHYECYKILNGHEYAAAWSHDNMWSLTVPGREGVACEVNGNPCRIDWQWDSDNMPECEGVAECMKNCMETGADCSQC